MYNNYFLNLQIETIKIKILIQKLVCYLYMLHLRSRIYNWKLTDLVFNFEKSRVCVNHVFLILLNFASGRRHGHVGVR